MKRQRERVWGGEGESRKETQLIDERERKMDKGGGLYNTTQEGKKK